MIYQPVVVVLGVDVAERLQPTLDAAIDAMRAGPRAVEWRELCDRHGWTLEMLAWGAIVTQFAGLIEDAA